MILENEIKLDFDDVLIKPKRSALESRKNVILYRTYKFKNSQEVWSGVPVIAANMDTVGTMKMYESLRGFDMPTVLEKHIPKEEFLKKRFSFDNNFGIPSIGASYEELDKFNNINDFMNFKFVCIDVANGYTEMFVDFVKKVREQFPAITIIAGNIVTGEMTQQLILSGADIVKVGIGPGSMCTTRKVTGVGYPQLSAIIECADAAHGMKAHIMADGGCRTPGDVVKAFGAGADFVMLGGMLAGHTECGGQQILGDDHILYREFYGMSSEKANDKYSGGLGEYKAAEGISTMIKDRGPVKNTVQQILGGLRSACTYVGTSELKHLSKCTTFIKVNNIHKSIEE